MERVEEERREERSEKGRGDEFLHSHENKKG